LLNLFFTLINKSFKFKIMAVIKVIELLADSNKSWEDAVKNAVAHAAKSVKNIRSVNVQNQSAVVKDNKITSFRVNVRITFEVK